MVFLNMETLQEWVEEFLSLGYVLPGTVRVVPQDGEDGADTGLVAATLASAPTVLYIQPVEVGAKRWSVTFEPREDAASMDAPTLTNLAAELTTMAALCTFLETRARDHIVADAP